MRDSNHRVSMLRKSSPHDFLIAVYAWGAKAGVVSCTAELCQTPRSKFESSDVGIITISFVD